MNVLFIFTSKCRAIRWIFLFALCALWSCCDAFSKEGVPLEKVKVLTLESHRMTKGSKPIPQLRCMGGSAGCKYAPQTVQCFNVGSDGIDYQWKCEADMSRKAKFGRLEVSCEGLNYPQDPIVVRGSCGLSYTLEKADSSDFKPSQGSFGPAITMAIFLGIFFLYICCRSDSRQTPSDSNARRSGPSYFSASAPPPPRPGFKTDFTGDSSSAYTNTQNAANDGPGFWSGLLAGGGLGYLFGRSQNTENEYDFRRRTRPTYPSYSSSYDDYGNSSRMFANDSDDETHTSTGYASTSRR